MVIGHGLSVRVGGGGDGMVVVVDALGVVVVPAVDVATGLLDPPGIGCDVVVVGVFVSCTFTHRCARLYTILPWRLTIRPCLRSGTWTLRRMYPWPHLIP
jgi:hypothetical protein